MRVLETADAAEKSRLTHLLWQQWRSGRIAGVGKATPPDRPARPPRPVLLPPGQVKGRKLGTPAGRLAFLHAIAHIELNAIDLAWDMVARFAAAPMPRAFADDWAGIADDEARHFDMLAGRLGELGGHYGDLAAYDGLWQAAMDTADDALARLAVVPMVLEARGLDTTPGAVTRLTQAGDAASAKILGQIGNEEIPHVGAGVRWFEYLCGQRGLAPQGTFHSLVKERFRGAVRGPFNGAARAGAGMDAAYYGPLALEPGAL